MNYIFPDVLDLTNAPISDPVFQPHLYYDWMAGLQIGISSCVGLVWWIVTWFVYIKTGGNDVDLNVNGTPTLPIEWFWHQLPNINAGWMAASYFSTFLAYLFVSFLEFIAWVCYLAGYTSFIRKWVEFSYYSIILYIPSWLFAFVQMAAPFENGGLEFMTPWQEYMLNSMFLFAGGILMWLYISLIHILYTQQLMDHIDTMNSICKCEESQPVVPEIGTKAREYAELLVKAECMKKCPPPEVLEKLLQQKEAVDAANLLSKKVEEELGNNADDDEVDGTSTW